VLVAVGLAGAGAAQEAPGPHPSFSIKLSGPQREVKTKDPVAVRATFTNISDHDFRNGAVPCRECKAGRRSDIDLRVYDSDGNPVPATPHGRRINGREEDQLGEPVSVFSFAIKPGGVFREDADLTNEFAVLKPGKYTVQAERPDPYSDGLLVKSNIITIAVVE